MVCFDSEVFPEHDGLHYRSHLPLQPPVVDEVNPIPERNIIFIMLYMYHVIYLKFNSYNDIWEKNTGISPFLLLHHIHDEIVLFRRPLGHEDL